jgi:copper chaperone
MERRTAYFPTMACGGCAAVIRRVLEALSGVTKVEVTVPDKLATVEWEPPLTWEAIREALADAGHPPE